MMLSSSSLDSTSAMLVTLSVASGPSSTAPRVPSTMSLLPSLCVYTYAPNGMQKFFLMLSVLPVTIVQVLR
eukprot:14568701-Ditylum_brightwellii.AAC.1